MTDLVTTMLGRFTFIRSHASALHGTKTVYQHYRCRMAGLVVALAISHKSVTITAKRRWRLESKTMAIKPGWRDTAAVWLDQYLEAA